MTLDEMITEVLDREGWPKFTDLPFDRGGPTRGGVSLRWYNAWLSQRGRSTITVEDLKVLPEASAREFFADSLAGPFKFVTDERIFEFLVDWSINAGPDDPARALQQRLTAWGCPCGTIDGVPGKKTRQAWTNLVAAGANLELFKFELVKARHDFHVREDFDDQVREFLRTHPTSALHNLRGHLNRTWSFAKPS